MEIRPRRIRTTAAMRRLVREVHLVPSQLVLPVFVADEPGPISSMPGVSRHSIDGVRAVASKVVEAGLGGIMLFGVPTASLKDDQGSQGIAPDGIVQRATRAVREQVGDHTVIMTDTCLDEFTSHGHCGVLTADGVVDNDRTNELYAQMALAQAEAGTHVVAPSGMMDGQVRHIRQALDAHGHQEVAILAYSAKYASAFYGPFREAVASTLVGDRRSYQIDPANRREGIREAALDEAEGADLVMVKPAGHYLDVLAEVAAASHVPVAAYQVSGEYSMVEAAAARGWIDRQQVVQESISAIVRAGADIVLTYWALELATWLK